MQATQSPTVGAAQRLSDLMRFYAITEDLARFTGGARLLADCSGRLDWPPRGVYFFTEPGEVRRESGAGRRIVRVGTHALKAGARTTLWNRVSQHKGQRDGNGNHRGSIFRLLVGAALLGNDDAGCSTWGQGSSAARDVRSAERDLESRVSVVIGQMSLLVLPINDLPGPDSRRGFIERNAIALLSNAGKVSLDGASRDWLGHRCPRERVNASGLWNQNHVEEAYDPAFLDVFATLVHAAERLG